MIYMANITVKTEKTETKSLITDNSKTTLMDRVTKAVLEQADKAYFRKATVVVQEGKVVPYYDDLPTEKQVDAIMQVASGKATVETAPANPEPTLFDKEVDFGMGFGREATLREIITLYYQKTGVGMAKDLAVEHADRYIAMLES